MLRRTSLSYFLILLLLALAGGWPTSVPSLLAEEEETELPEPIDEKLESKDAISKLVMHCTYYPSLLGKEAIPVLLLHGRGGTRADYEFLATYLQQQGHAVIVPDLRGHGDSSEVLLANGQHVKLIPSKMKKLDFLAMAKDLEVIKSWLLQKNNAEELNMEMLVVVGADMSTVTAMNFALRDWTVPELINYKNCKDVKALVLLSPQRTYEGTDMNLALKHPSVGHALSIMVAVGKKDSSADNEAKKIVTLLERQHGEVASNKKKKEDKEIVFYAEDTSLQGTKLVDENMKVGPIIAQFIQFRVRAFADSWEWTARIKPGEEK